MLLSDTLSFWRAWLRAPRRMGAVAPSGPSLARLITRHVNHRLGPVIELGPGTGVFTRALLATGLPAHRLALVEADVGFADSLSREFPGARVLRMDAAHLGDTSPLFGDERASAVISGLPLLAMPQDQVAAIIGGVFDRQLRPDGALYQFTYGLKCPLSPNLLDQLDLESVRVGSVLFNLPPATVYRIGRRQRRSVAA